MINSRLQTITTNVIVIVIVKMNKSLSILSTIIFGFTLTAGVAFAAGETNQCQPIYGGGESCPKVPQIEINKTVQNPETQGYVDNLSASDPKFAPTETVTFKITVKNTSDQELTKITIKDVFPNVVEFVNGVGNFDAGSRTLTIPLEKLSPNEARDFFVQAKVVAADKLPANQNVVCVINQSSITVAEKTAQDNAQFCIEKGLKPEERPTTKGGQPVNPPVTKGGKPVYPTTTATTTPETGPEALALIGLIPSALGGAYLRRKTK
jgi:uncharacterized repeat protein (TIGR01451 family)